MRSVIFQTVAPIVLHLTLIFSMFLLLYGHHQPGGGFIAGLMTAVGLVLQWVAFDADEGSHRFHWPWEKFYTYGLGLSALVGIVGLLSGAYLKSSHFELHPPLIGTVEVFTAFLFDIGVYGVVVGVTMSILVNLCTSEETPEEENVQG